MRDLLEIRAQLRDLEDKKKHILDRLQVLTLQDYLRSTIQQFGRKTEAEKKVCVQAIIPEIIIHQDNSVELRINPDPNGSAPVNYHSGGNNVVLIGKWRSGRPSPPRVRVPSTPQHRTSDLSVLFEITDDDQLVRVGPVKTDQFPKLTHQNLTNHLLMDARKFKMTWTRCEDFGS